MASTKPDSLPVSLQRRLLLQLEHQNEVIAKFEDKFSMLEDKLNQIQNELNPPRYHVNINRDNVQNASTYMAPRVHRAYKELALSESSSSEDERIKNSEFRTKCMAEAIQRRFADAVDCLPFKESEIPDDIVPEILSDSECEYIRNLDNRKDQVRTFLGKVIKGDFKAMMKYLSVVDRHNKRVSDNIRDTFAILMDCKTGINNVCAVCSLKSNVNIKDVSDFFYSELLVSEQLQRQITETKSKESDQNDLWEILFSELEAFPSECIMRNMITALNRIKPSFSNIARQLGRDIQRNRRFMCRCKKEELPHSRAFSSTTESSNSTMGIRSSSSSSDTTQSVADENDTTMLDSSRAKKLKIQLNFAHEDSINVDQLRYPGEEDHNKLKRPHKKHRQAGSSRQARQRNTVEHQSMSNGINTNFQETANLTRNPNALIGIGTVERLKVQYVMKLKAEHDIGDIEKVTLRPGKRERQTMDVTKRHAKTEQMLY